MSVAPSTSPSRRRLKWLAAAGALVAACVAVWLVLLRDRRAYGEPRKAFEGDSTGLRYTVIVPTLETPMPAGKNVIWCASFQAAWNRLKNDVIKEPVRIKGAEGVCKRLNRSKVTEADLPEGSYYAAAGFVEDGTVTRIRREMSDRFPDAGLGLLDEATESLIAFAYLATAVRFDIPFFDSPEGLAFADSDGNMAAVTSFGVPWERHDAYMRLRSQIDILYDTTRTGGGSGESPEFAIDPCNTSKPSQIVLANIPPGGTLAQTLEYLEAEMAAFGETRRPLLRRFGRNEVLLVPNVAWDITHHFTELEAKEYLNRGFEREWIDDAILQIAFRLDRSGAELESEAQVSAACEPRVFVFNRPFLILMRKRGSQRPFFVMWVDNAELLCKW